MRFAALTSDKESTGDAIAEVVAGAREFSKRIDLAFVFFTPQHEAEAESIVEKIWLELDPEVVVGCCAEGVIGADREIERAAGLSVLVGETPGVHLHPFHISREEWATVLREPGGLKEKLGAADELRAVIAIGDPYSTPVNQLLEAMDRELPGVPLAGGMASAANAAGKNLLVRNDALYADGLVGVAMSGNVRAETVVSQGCRPIGRPLVVTGAKENIIHTLGNRPAMTALGEIVNELSDEDRQLLERGLLIGRAISEYRESFGRGDFLVRNLMGADKESGAIAVADHVRVGQTVQFQVRDAATAREDLQLMLTGQKETAPAAAALLFSCNGRGSRLFDKSCEEISLAKQLMPQTPVAGFFAAGELGPVGGHNFIHGHTASFLLLRPAIG